MGEERRADVAARVREILAADPVYLDTETTGLGYDDQVVEIAIVDATGKVLLDTLVRPTCPIGEGASVVHGINAKDIENAPTFAQVQPLLAEVLNGRVVVIYNATYDVRMLRQSGVARRIKWNKGMEGVIIWCAMELYSEFWGEWSEWHQSYRWQKLTDAARDRRVKLPEGMAAHRALADAELTRRVMMAMAIESAGE